MLQSHRTPSGWWGRVIGVVLLILASAAVAVPAAPLLQVSFEDVAIGGVPRDWTIYGQTPGTTVSDAQAHTGKRSLHLLDPTKTESVGLRSPRVPVKGGADYWVSWWYRAAPKQSGTFYLEFWDKDGTRIEDEVSSLSCNSSGRWERQLLSFSTPAQAVALTVLPYSCVVGITDAYYDDITVGEGVMALYDRTPLPPASVQHPCGLYRAADLARARENLQRHQWAKDVLTSLKSRADWWLNLPDDQIPFWIPDLTPIRVCECPKCGASWHTDYAFKYLPDGRVECTRCHTVYPNADYPENGREVLRNPLGEKVEYTFHQSAAGKKYRLSGLARYGRISKLSSVGAMGIVYALTGERAYAEKAVKVLRRVAQVYPGYVPSDWTRFYLDYSNLQSGKLSGWKLHDAGTFLQLGTCYDLIYNSGCLTDADKTLIENGAFREALRLFTATSPQGCCINDGPSAMACGALLGVILGDHDAIKWAISPPDGFVGFVHKYFFRDGFWKDGSFSYSGMTLGPLYATPEILQGYSDPPTYKGADRYDRLDLRTDPILRKVYTAPLRVLRPDGTGPTISDSTLNAHYQKQHAETNAFWYPSERSQAILAHVFGGKYDEDGSEYALFRRPPDASLKGVAPLDLSADSLVEPGVGWGILRSGRGPDTAAVYLKYGVYGSGHGHPDKLNLDFYDNRTELITDLGYLGAGHGNTAWNRCTLAHNTVMIDGQAQLAEDGELLAFAAGDGIQSIVGKGPAVYPQATRYERSVVLVDHGVGRRYLVDVFRVAGGKQHDYVIHGAGPTFTRPDGQWAPLEGELVTKEASGGGKWLSGIEQAVATGDAAAEWREGADGVRVDLLGQPETSLIHAIGPGLRDRYDPWGKRDLHLLLARRAGPTNTYVAVIQAVRGATAPFRVAAAEVQSEHGDVRAVRVTGDNFEDLIVIGEAASATGLTTCGPLSFRGQQAVYSVVGGVPNAWLMNGTTLTAGSIKLTGQPAVTGKVLAVDQRAYAIRVSGGALPLGDAARGQQLLIAGAADGAYEIERIERLSAKESLVHLADEPQLNLKPGQTFTFLTSRLARAW